MKFGVPVGNFGQFGKRGDAPAQVQVAVAAERFGFDSVWVHDHLVMPADIRARYPYNDSGVAGFAWRQDIYDPLAMMAALAVATERVDIGTSVLIIPYRNPVVLARMLATVDQLAGGRVRLGAGVGWMQEEFEALGIGDWFPVRGRVTDEWIAICRALWAGAAPISYEGRFFSCQDAAVHPKPAHGTIPVWVGGWGDVAARRVARLGDGFQTISSTPKMVADQLALVRQELEKRGRSLAEIEVSMLGGIRIGEAAGAAPSPVIGGSTQQIIDQLGTYAEAGLQHLIATPRRAGAPAMTPAAMIEDMQWLAEEVFPALR